MYEWLKCKGGKICFNQRFANNLATTLGIDLNKVRTVNANKMGLPYLQTTFSSGKGATSVDCIAGNFTVESVGNVQGEFALERKGEKCFVSHDFFGVIERKDKYEIVSVIFTCEV